MRILQKNECLMTNQCCGHILEDNVSTFTNSNVLLGEESTKITRILEFRKLVNPR